MAQGELRTNGADPLAKDSKAAIWFPAGLQGAVCSACGGGVVESPIFRQRDLRENACVGKESRWGPYPHTGQRRSPSSRRPAQQGDRPSWSQQLCVVVRPSASFHLSTCRALPAVSRTVLSPAERGEVPTDLNLLEG